MDVKWKENYKPVSLTKNRPQKSSTSSTKWIWQHTERIMQCNQVGFIPGMQGWLNTCESINTMYCSNKYCEALITQVMSDLCDPLDCSPPGTSIHEILQARMLEWVAVSFSSGSSWSRDRIWVSCTAGRFFPL